MTRSARGRRETDGAANESRPDGRKQSTRSTMSASGDTRAGDDSRPGDEPSTSFWQRFLHDRSVRARIATLVLLPLLATAVLGAFFVKDALDNSNSASRVETLASVGLNAADAFYAVQDERDVTVLIDAGGEYEQSITDVRTITDNALEDLRDDVDSLRGDDFGPEVTDAIANFERNVDRLPDFRAQHDDRAPLTDVALPDNYHNVAEGVRGLITAAAAVVDEPSNAQLLRALNDITQATESASMERGQFAYYIIEGERVGSDQQELASSLQAEQRLLIQNFLGNISDPTLRREYSDQISSGNRKITGVRGDINSRSDLRSNNQQWFSDATSRIDVLRQIEQDVARAIVDDSSSTASNARVVAGVSGAIVLAILLLTAVLTLVVARSIIGPLRRLRATALDTANTNLPALVDRIQQDGPAATRQNTVAVRAEGRDEIGQVATAFNDVHATAVRVASEQALLRQNLDTIVVNLSRRTQSLVDRQLTEIEGLESRERDPDQLSTLFRIDHIATRVRRHAESLLVLAGVEEMRKQSAASPILDVVRAAVGEVEQYPRVEFGVMPTDLVSATAVDDVSHLLAELIDNATEFSAPSTPVTVTSQPLLGGGLRIQVTDTGLGIPPDQLTELNNRLNSPGDIDVAASRTLGLYVVARLANKHGIQVRLEPASQGTGTIAQIDLPSSLILSPLDTTDGVVPTVSDASGDRPQATDPGVTPQIPTAAQPPAAAPQTPNQPVEPLTAQTDPGGLPRRQADPGSSPGQPPLRPVQTPPDQPADPPPAEPVQAQSPPSLPSRPSPGEPTVGQQAGTESGGAPSAPDGSLWSRENPFDRANSNGSRPQPGEGRAQSAPPQQPSVEPLTQRPATPPAAPPPEREAPPDSLRAPQPELPTSNTPVYDAMRSAWFSEGDGPKNWASPADEGWRRAANALRAAEEAATARKNRDQPEPAPGPAAPERPSAPPPPASRPAPGDSPTPQQSRPTPLPTRGGAHTPHPEPLQPEQPRPEQPRPEQPRPEPPQPEPPQPEPRQPEQPAASWTSGGQPGPAAEGDPQLHQSGLPMRRKGASLVPGSIDALQNAQAEQQPEEAATPDPRDAGSVASTLSSLQRGVSRGREETGGWVPKRPGGQGSGPERSSS